MFGISTNTPGFFDNAAALPGLLLIDPPPPLVPGVIQGLPNFFGGNGIGVLIPSFLPVGEFSLGNTLPAGLTEAGIEAAGFTLQFAGPANPDPENAVSAPDNVFIVSGVPEPGSLSLLALAGLGIVARRRR